MELRNLFVTKETTYQRCLICDKVHKSNKKDLVCCDNSLFTKYKTVNDEINEWEYETPKEIRAHAIKDLIKAYTTCFANLKNKNIKNFKMRFRSKKNNQSIVIQKQSIKYHDKQFHIYNMSLGAIKIGKRSIKDYVINNDCRLSFDGNSYFLHLLKNVEIKNYTKNGDTTALDPGLRTFMTGYSQEEVIECKIRPELIKKLRKKIDILNSLRSKKKLRNKKKIKKANLRLGNIVDDLHWKTITYLTKNYKNILLPAFESQKMLGNNKYINRSFMNLKHYQFKTRLIDKVKSINDTKLYIVTEEYTSKTCSNCGNLKFDLFTDKVYNCVSCKICIDRDINGARNIYMKNMEKYPAGVHAVKV